MAEHESGGMGELRLPEEPPRWPKVVGTISLVWAGIGLTCAGCGVVGSVVGPMMMPKNMGELPPTMEPGLMQWALIAVGLVNTGILIAAGMLTVGRKPAGRLLHLVWAGLSVPIAVATVVHQLRLRQEMIAWAVDHSDSPFAKGADSPFGLLILAVVLLPGLVWMGFCFAWFGGMGKNPAVGVEERAA